MRNLDKKERLLESVKGLHRDTMDILQMDVTDQRSIHDARDRVVEKRVDILGRPVWPRFCVLPLINQLISIPHNRVKNPFFSDLNTNFSLLSVCNAGVGLMGPLELQSLNSMRQILEVNLLGTIQTIQAFLPEMKAQGRGHILVTGSTGGLHGETK